MAISAQFQGSIQISDITTGLIQANKTISALFSSASVATVADTLVSWHRCIYDYLARKSYPVSIPSKPTC